MPLFVISLGAVERHVSVLREDGRGAGRTFRLAGGAGLLLRAVFASVLILLLVQPWVYLRRPAGISDRVVPVTVPPETTFREVAALLERSGILRGRRMFVLAGRFAGIDRRVQYGTYTLEASMTPWEILRLLDRGEVEKARITAPEGLNLFELARLLSEAGIVREQDFLRAARDAQVLSTLGITAESAEGYCYPDTYVFPKGTPPFYVLRAMVSRFRDRVGRLLDETAPPPGLDSSRDVVILASIVEREAREPGERALIAGVYLNRLRRSIRLEADPTAVYGVRQRGERITAEDVRRQSPYNTYYIPGLPPGPIANPGEATIRAVLAPRETRALYFVARGDGTHEFSETFRGHGRAVRRLKSGGRR